MRALATYPALGSVRMPASAVIVAVHPHATAGGGMAPSLLVEYNADDQETVERHFVTLSCTKGTPVPGNAGYVSSWRRHPADGGLAALYERFDANLPDDLPDDQARSDYRLLLGEGYEPCRPFPTSGGARHHWHAPNDQPPGGMSLDAMQAVARLQEHGYGSVVE